MDRDFFIPRNVVTVARLTLAFLSLPMGNVYRGAVEMLITLLVLVGTLRTHLPTWGIGLSWLGLQVLVLPVFVLPVIGDDMTLWDLWLAVRRANKCQQKFAADAVVCGANGWSTEEPMAEEPPVAIEEMPQAAPDPAVAPGSAPSIESAAPSSGLELTNPHDLTDRYQVESYGQGGCIR